jgi:hypothetical protein
VAIDGVLERIHEPVHYRRRSKSLEAILDFHENWMSVPMPNVHIDDMNVFEFCIE